MTISIKTSAVLRIAACLLGLATLPAAHAASLNACVVEGNAPFSSRDGGAKGLDIEVMQAVAARMGRDLQLTWITVPARGGMGRALKQTVQAGTCELFVGLPETVDGGEDLAERNLVASRPYASVGYALVVPAASKAKALGDLRAARVGGITATPADLHLLAGGYNRTPYGSVSQMLEAVARGELGGALVWSGRLAETPLPASLRLAQVLREPTLTTRFVIAYRRGDAALGSELDAVLTAFAADGTLDALARKAGFP